MTYAYFAPDTVLPLASTVAAVVGVLLLSARGARAWLAHGFASKAEINGVDAVPSK